jgi:hypothetical protein
MTLSGTNKKRHERNKKRQPNQQGVKAAHLNTDGGIHFAIKRLGNRSRTMSIIVLAA